MKVYSLTDTGDSRWIEVSRTYKALRADYFVINDSIRVTNDHPFFIDGEWKNTDELVIGDELIDIGGTLTKVESITMVDAGVRVFNIDVLSPDTFFANGILVHNKDPFPVEP